MVGFQEAEEVLYITEMQILMQVLQMEVMVYLEVVEMAVVEMVLMELTIQEEVVVLEDINAQEVMVVQVWLLLNLLIIIRKPCLLLEVQAVVVLLISYTH